MDTSDLAKAIAEAREQQSRLEQAAAAVIENRDALSEKRADLRAEIDRVSGLLTDALKDGRSNDVDRYRNELSSLHSAQADMERLLETATESAAFAEDRVKENATALAVVVDRAGLHASPSPSLPGGHHATVATKTAVPARPRHRGLKWFLILVVDIGCMFAVSPNNLPAGLRSLSLPAFVGLCLVAIVAVIMMCTSPGGRRFAAGIERAQVQWERDMFGGTQQELQAQEAARLEARRQSQLQIVCPHCGVRGHVVASTQKIKQGISGGKATAAIATGGYSLLATGLSRKVDVTKLHCRNCAISWTVS